MKYSKHDIVRLTGITYRQFERWRTRGLVQPAHGRGPEAYYTSEHLDRVREVVREVVDGRVTLVELEERFRYADNPELLDDGDVWE